MSARVGNTFFMEMQNEETLVQVAERVYGDATKYRDLYEANRDRLDSPQNLRPDLILVVP